jgi:hypothetical protein
MGKRGEKIIFFIFFKIKGLKGATVKVHCCKMDGNALF